MILHREPSFLKKADCTIAGQKALTQITTRCAGNPGVAAAPSRAQSAPPDPHAPGSRYAPLARIIDCAAGSSVGHHKHQAVRRPVVAGWHTLTHFQTSGIPT